MRSCAVSTLLVIDTHTQLLHSMPLSFSSSHSTRTSPPPLEPTLTPYSSTFIGLSALAFGCTQGRDVDRYEVLTTGLSLAFCSLRYPSLAWWQAHARSSWRVYEGNALAQQDRVHYACASQTGAGNALGVCHVRLGSREDVGETRASHRSTHFSWL